MALTLPATILVTGGLLWHLGSCRGLDHVEQAIERVLWPLLKVIPKVADLESLAECLGSSLKGKLQYIY